MAVKVREENVISSPEDKRQYRGLVLSNDLKVMLISDPTTDKSAAALDVHVGCLSDPRSIPGLAHFCEHMLFMGTEKYSCENEYNKFLNENGGCSNAYTGLEHTNYFFNVSPDALKGALDRFAQFFISPLFLESSVEREINAVHSEHEKNLQDDSWRVMQLTRSTSNPVHDFCKFGTGNRDTLGSIPKSQNIDVREELLRFHKKWYSGNVMGLSILGKESLDELEAYAVEMFSCIKTCGVELPVWNDHPFRSSECKKEIHVVPVKDIRTLTLTFPLPDLHPYYKSAPGLYLSHLIGHEGPGSLLSFLKDRGWVSTLCGGQSNEAKGFGFFNVNVDLTEDGINHTDEIVQSVFEYLNLIKQGGIKEWIFDECKVLNKIAFRFKDKENPMSYVCQLAGKLHKYSLEEALYGDYAMNDLDTDLTKWVLSMLKTENVRVTVLGKGNECKANLKEEWYGTDYCISDISEDKIKRWEGVDVNESLQLPEPNRFIPNNFQLPAHSENISEFPALIFCNDMCSVWYKLDTEFNLPKSCIYVELFSPLAYVDPCHANLMHMFIQLYRDNLTEFSYDAALSGLNYSVTNTKYGFTIALHGYTEKQCLLLEKIVEELIAFKINPKRFEILKENYIRTLKNFACEQPHTHLVYYTSLILSEQAWSKEDLLGCIDDLTISSLEAFIPRLLSSLHLEFLVHGSLSRAKAEDMCRILIDQLSSNRGTKPLLPQQYRRMRECMLEPGSSYLLQTETKMHNSSAAEVFLQFGSMKTRINVLLELLIQVIQEPAFDQLRTKEQLGYIVWCHLRRAHGTQGLRIIVQGERHPQYLDNRIEVFLSQMGQFLQTLSEEEYTKHLSALIKQRLERPKKLPLLTGKWWTEITSNNFNFDRDQIEVDELRTVTKEDLIRFYEKYVDYRSPDRKKMSVHVVSVAEKGAGHKRFEDEVSVDKSKTESVRKQELPDAANDASLSNKLSTVGLSDEVCSKSHEVNLAELKEPERIECIPTFKMSLGLHSVTKPFAPLSTFLTKDSKAKL